MKNLLFAVSLILLIFLINISNVNAENTGTLNPVLDTTQVYKPENTTDPPPNNNVLDFSRPVITGRVAEEQYLPPSLYGTWQVTQTLIDTNAPYIFKQRTSDIWVLQQVGKKIRLHNPNTRAQSIITVNMVHNNTATFTCVVRTGNREEAEQPTITVNNDEFHGRNIYQIRYYSGQKIVRLEKAIFKIDAQKLSGPTPRIFIRQNRN